MLSCSCYWLPQNSETLSTCVLRNTWLVLLGSLNRQQSPWSNCSPFSPTVTQLTSIPLQSETLRLNMSQGAARSRRGVSAFFCTNIAKISQKGMKLWGLNLTAGIYPAVPAFYFPSVFIFFYKSAALIFEEFQGNAMTALPKFTNFPDHCSWR